MVRSGITVYLPRELEAFVRGAAREEARSESSIITEAVRLHFNRRNDQSAPADGTHLHMAAHMDARFDKAIGEAAILKEVMLLFIRMWLERNPPIDEGSEDAASNEPRFERFLDLVRDGLERRSGVNGEFTVSSPPDANGDQTPP